MTALLLAVSLLGAQPPAVYTPPPVSYPYGALTARRESALYVTGGTVVEQEVVRSTELYVAVRWTWR